MILIDDSKYTRRKTLRHTGEPAIFTIDIDGRTLEILIDDNIEIRDHTGLEIELTTPGRFMWLKSGGYNAIIVRGEEAGE